MTALPDITSSRLTVQREGMGAGVAIASGSRVSSRAVAGTKVTRPAANPAATIAAGRREGDMGASQGGSNPGYLQSPWSSRMPLALALALASNVKSTVGNRTTAGGFI